MRTAEVVNERDTNLISGWDSELSELSSGEETDSDEDKSEVGSEAVGFCHFCSHPFND
jgi:hypothetical protein